MGKTTAVVGTLVAFAGVVIALISLFQAIGAQYSDDQHQSKDLSYQEIQLTEIHRQVELQEALLSIQTALLKLHSQTPQAVPEATSLANEIATLQIRRAEILQEMNAAGIAAPAGVDTPMPASTPVPAATPTPTVALSFGPNQIDAPPVSSGRSKGSGNNMESSSGAVQPTPHFDQRDSYVGNLITCVPPNPPNYAWIWIYRLNDKNEWVRISKGIGSIERSGYLKVNGLPVDVTRFGALGEPYKIEQIINGHVAHSTGDFQKGEPEFRIYPWQDSKTSWGCP